MSPGKFYIFLIATHHEGAKSAPRLGRLLTGSHCTEGQELQDLLHDNKTDCIRTFLQGLTPTESTKYSIWKATKKLMHI
jgi:hypothetical protein